MDNLQPISAELIPLMLVQHIELTVPSEESWKAALSLLAQIETCLHGNLFVHLEVQEWMQQGQQLHVVLDHQKQQC